MCMCVCVCVCVYVCYAPRAPTSSRSTAAANFSTQILHTIAIKFLQRLRPRS